MAILFIRTILLYVLTVIAVKVMGKRQIGQLQPFELVVLLIISEMASLAMQSNTMPLGYSITPIIVVTLLQILVSLLILKSEKVRGVVCGRPVALIEKKQFNEAAMARLRINLNDLQEMARAQGYFDLSSIEYAIMETNGSLSILPCTEKRPLQVSDMMANPPQEIISRLFILDGNVNHSALQAAGYNEIWLNEQVHKFNCSNPREIFLAGLDDSGTFFAQKKSTGKQEKQK